MRSNALKKQDFTPESPKLAVVASTQDAWEAKRRSIAQTAEAACHLPGNINGPDFEEFLSQDGQPAPCDFA